MKQITIAVGEGFEPPLRSHVSHVSNVVLSTSQSSHHFAVDSGIEPLF